MKKLILCLSFMFISMSCTAQKAVKTTRGFKNQKIPYITAKSFKDIKINNKLKLKSISRYQSLKDVINLLGQPQNIRNEKDKAVDGTILLERKILEYPGLLLVFPKKQGSYKLSRIDFISGNSSLKINGKRLKVGMSVQNIKSFVPNTKQLNSKNSFRIYVADTKQNRGLNKKPIKNVRLSNKTINIDINSTNQTVKKISILMYTI